MKNFKPPNFYSPLINSCWTYKNFEEHTIQSLHSLETDQKLYKKRKKAKIRKSRIIEYLERKLKLSKATKVLTLLANLKPTKTIIVE